MIVFKDLLRAYPESETMTVISGACEVTGTGESIACMLDEHLLKDCEVISIEARDNELWVWIGEH